MGPHPETSAPADHPPAGAEPIPETTSTGDAAKIDRILNILDALDWEIDDRQYALEKIEAIAREGLE